MRRIILLLPLVMLAMLTTGGNVLAALTVEEFEIEGLISPASPKALSKALEKRLQVKVVDLNLKNSSSGWPLLSVEFDFGSTDEERYRANNCIDRRSGRPHLSGPPGTCRGQCPAYG